ncbi:hypothetical protein V4890_04425 [Ralstonia solanacearum species complex bacterium KE056]|uniref:hypothetical protein n=1 Tax=Ralstonia solanacearum species complex bacterium KE056 TaxID=3119585 RepID=UPI002FC2D10A
MSDNNLADAVDHRVEPEASRVARVNRDARIALDQVQPTAHQMPKPCECIDAGLHQATGRDREQLAHFQFIRNTDQQLVNISAALARTKIDLRLTAQSPESILADLASSPDCSLYGNGLPITLRQASTFIKQLQKLTKLHYLSTYARIKSNLKEAFVCESNIKHRSLAV